MYAMRQLRQVMEPKFDELRASITSGLCNISAKRNGVEEFAPTVERHRDSGSEAGLRRVTGLLDPLLFGVHKSE